jgi:hypothetical protein
MSILKLSLLSVTIFATGFLAGKIYPSRAAVGHEQVESLEARKLEHHTITPTMSPNLCVASLDPKVVAAELRKVLREERKLAETEGCTKGSEEPALEDDPNEVRPEMDALAQQGHEILTQALTSGSWEEHHALRFREVLRQVDQNVASKLLSERAQAINSQKLRLSDPALL